MVNLIKIIINKLKQSALPLTLVDQGLVSGVNFITGILLARGLGLEGFGQFGLLWVIVLFLNTLQSSLITFPMMTIGPKFGDNNTEASSGYFNATFCQQLIFSLVAASLLALGIWLSQWFAPSWGVSELWHPFLVVTANFQVQDYLRRYFFTVQRPGLALVNDFISYGGQLLVLVMLWANHHLTLTNALWGIGLTSLLAIIIGFTQIKRPSLKLDWSSVSRNWQFGSWMTVSNTVQWSGSQGLILLAGVFFGPVGVGGLRAVFNLISPINVLTQGLQNYLPGTVSRIHYYSKGKGTVKYLIKLGFILVLVMSLVGLALTLFASNLMTLFYGSEFNKYAGLVGWQAGYIVLSGIVLPFTLFYRTIENNRKIAICMALAAPAALLTIVLLHDSLGLASIFMGLIVNQLAAIVFLVVPTDWLKYFRSIKLKSNRKNSEGLVI